MLKKEEVIDEYGRTQEEWHKYSMRAPQLMAMHKFMLNANDENITMTWLSGGVPDGADDLDYLDISTDDNLYIDCCELFTELVQKIGWRF